MFALVELWRCAKAGLLCAVWLLSAPSAHALATDIRFSPLGYRDYGNQVPIQDTPQQVCDVWAAWWGWNKYPFSHQLTDDLPGRWKCQRFYNGNPEPSQYTYVRGTCQREPAPIATGSDWSHPTYDSRQFVPCTCGQSMSFDRSVEWCTGAPSCLTYPDNKRTECGKTVDALVNAVKPRSDPTRHFHRTQTCIARSTCDLRCRMEHCDWLKAVIPAFVDPYLQKSGEWPNIEAECRERGSGWLNDRDCARSMARNHIFHDLLPALVRYGCGSESDWQQVFSAISSCARSTFDAGAVEMIAIKAPVYLYRETVRATCLASRTVSRRDPEINEDLSGKVCTP